MSTRNTLIGLVILIVVVVLIIMRMQSPAAPASEQTTIPTATTTDTIANTSTTTISATSTTAATITKAYTLSEVSTHSTASSCWTTVNGNVYDVTTWINRHPGGPQAILSLCGKDGTATFATQHAGQPKPETMLASFKIGVLAQ